MDICIVAQNFYDYSLYIKGHSKKTIKRYKYVIDSYSRITGVTTLDQATGETVRSLLYYGRTERNWSSNTAIVFHKSLTIFFRWCISQKIISQNPMEGIEKVRLEQRLPVKLTKQDALRLLEIVENYPYEHSFLRYRNHAMFSMFVFAGLRKNELLNLKYTDVDLESLTIFVRQGKGAKDRIIPICLSLARTLGLYIEERKKRHKNCPEFFTSLQYNKPFTENGLKHFVDRLKPIFGMRFSIHKLRHTFATLMIEGGCDIYSLSRMMGHSDIKTTTIYLHSTVEHLRSQIMKHPLDNNKIYKTHSTY